MKCRSLIALRVAVAVFVGLIVIGCPSQAIAKPSEVINWKFQSHHTPGALSSNGYVRCLAGG